MKTTIRVELPDYDEDNSLSESVERLVAERVVRELKDDAKEAVRKMLVERATAEIDELVRAAVNDPVRLTSAYGEMRRGLPVTLREHIVKLATDYMSAKVNARNGKDRQYNDPECSRIEYMIWDSVRKAVAQHMASVEEKVKAEAIAAMSAWLETHGLGDGAKAE